MTHEVLAGWDGFFEWATLFYAMEDFDQEERDYKFRAVEPLIHSLELLSTGGEWLPELRRGFTNTSSNIVSFWVYTPFLAWANENPDSAAKVMSELWTSSNVEGPTRIDSFGDLLPSDVLPGKGSRCNLAAFLLGAIDPIGWPNYRVTASKTAYELTRTPMPAPDYSLGERYGHALDFFDEVVRQAQERGIPSRDRPNGLSMDRLDAQGLMWCVTQWRDRPSNFTTEEWQGLLAYRSLPSTLRKESAAKAQKLKAPRRPALPVCHLCGSTDEVIYVRPEGGRWKFVCEAGPGHPDPYEFLHG